MKKEQPNSPGLSEEFPESASPVSASSEDVVFTPASSSPTEPEAPLRINATVIADQILSFLSTATPELLAATIAGGAILLYVLLGTVGLMFVGVLLGIVLHASLENWGSPTLTSRRAPELMAGWLGKRKEQECNGEDAEGEETVILRGRSASRHRGPVDFSSLSPETAAAFTELTDAVIRDYVRWWYSPILRNDDNFPSSCRQLLAQTLLKMHAHISRKRPTDTFLLFLISTSNTFIVLLRELAQTSQTSIGMYIEEYPSSALAQLVDRESQRQKLRMAADNILQTFLPSEALDSELVRTFLTQILAGVVLEKTVEKCSSADFINGWIIYLLEPETQPEILQKIDIGEATSGAVKEEAGAATAEEQERKRLSRAEEEMEKAMKEAQELSKMIAEDEARASKSSSEFGSAATSGSAITKDHITESPLSDKGVDFSSITQQAPEGSVAERGEISPPPLPARPAAFTSFDQIVPPAEPQDILFRAHVELSDLTPTTNLGASSEKPLRSKPTAAVYLLQIEPSSSSTPGWILTRKFADFESLHEVLIRLSKISGIADYSELPEWKGQTSESLRSQLERFLNRALKIQVLAECEGMKRFLEKDTSTMGATSGSPGGAFAGLGKGWPNSQALAKVGGGVLGVLSKAPQGAAESGKALFGGVFRGGVGMKRLSSGNPPDNGSGTQGPQDGLPAPRGSLESLRSSQQEGSRSLATTSEETVTDDGTTEAEKQKPELPPRVISAEVDGQKPPLPPRRPTSLRQSLQVETPWDDGELLNLPPPPSDMPDDYSHDLDPGALSRKRSGSAASSLLPNPRSLPLTSGVENPTSTQIPTPSTSPPPLDPPKKKSSPPLSTAEAQFVVEIVFAIISELYTLSSAWIFRRSLLNVAKSILLRPGNASLESIRVLIQETVIASNTTDSAVSEYVRKLRESVFPTATEMEAWGPAATPADEAARRDKARDLVRERGLPEALRGVMGNVASAECCAAMFDALQEEPVARGVVCGIVLDAVRGFCE